MSALGLKKVGNLSAFLSDDAPKGGALSLPITDIDEDPGQPRRFFDPASLEELAETIRQRGVKSPISVRPNPEAAGRYIVNHGARRLRASVIAGRDTIPCFIDSDYSSADQVIENLQRDALTAREIADYIGSQLALKVSQSEIARRIGKSPAYVNQHVTLLDLPDPIATAFTSGRCSDVTVVNQLVKLHRQAPEMVESWLEDEQQDITRTTIATLKDLINPRERKDQRTAALAEGISALLNGQEKSPQAPAQGDLVDFIKEQTPTSTPAPASSAGNNAPPADLGGPAPAAPVKPTAPEASPTVAQADERDDGPTTAFRKAIVCVRHDERPARLVLNRRPSTAGLGWIKYEDDGSECEVALDLVFLSHLMEG
jgi:ParB family transcriptional regulator, chromosome partitioning protein